MAVACAPSHPKLRGDGYPARATRVRNGGSNGEAPPRPLSQAPETRASEMTKRKSNNPKGRPSTGLSEARQLVVGPAALFAAIKTAAQREGVSASEWWRRAARARLGWQLAHGEGET
jgi:hypothetical protein